MQELIGRTVTAVWMDPEHDRIVFETDQDPLAYWTGADCCSRSYFNDIIGLDNLLDHRVNAVEELELPNVPSDGYDLIRAYGIKLTTDRGYVDIIYRNESNGYYGGYCQLDSLTEIDLHMIRVYGPDWSRDA